MGAEESCALCCHWNDEDAQEEFVDQWISEEVLEVKNAEYETEYVASEGTQIYEDQNEAAEVLNELNQEDIQGQMQNQNQGIVQENPNQDQPEHVQSSDTKKGSEIYHEVSHDSHEDWHGNRMAGLGFTGSCLQDSLAGSSVGDRSSHTTPHLSALATPQEGSPKASAASSVHSSHQAENLNHRHAIKGSEGTSHEVSHDSHEDWHGNRMAGLGFTGPCLQDSLAGSSVGTTPHRSALASPQEGSSNASAVSSVHSSHQNLWAMQQ